jgi:Uma2 family endonuclease
MASVPPETMTLAEFLAWERRQEARFEFDGTRAVAMADVTVGHDTISGALRVSLLGRLRGTPCRARGPTMKVELAGRVYYPDAFVYCGYLPGSTEIVTAPIVVFEVLSDDTTPDQRAIRRHAYQASSSVQRYVVLERDAIAATEFTREKGLWTARTLYSGDRLAMPEIGIEIGLAEIYADADWLAPEAVSERIADQAIDALLHSARHADTSLMTNSTPRFRSI